MKPLSLAIAFSSTLVFSACGQDDHLLLPDQLEIYWDASFNGVDDGLGAVVPVEVMVYDGLTGQALPDVIVSIQGDRSAVRLLNSERVMPFVVDCLDCDVVWDAYRDEYYALSVAGVEGAGSLRVETDEDGIAHLYVVIDAFPRQGDLFEPIQVHVETETVQGTFSLWPR